MAVRPRDLKNREPAVGRSGWTKDGAAASQQVTKEFRAYKTLFLRQEKRLRDHEAGTGRLVTGRSGERSGVKARCSALLSGVD